VLRVLVVLKVLVLKGAGAKVLVLKVLTVLEVQGATNATFEFRFEPLPHSCS
jgi:hypothetical protein